LLREPFRLPLAFFASGAAALLFQVLWFRALGRVLGMLYAANTFGAGALAAYSMCRAGLHKRAAAVKGADRLAPGLRCWRD
jgi:hypothetical protein